ncbi:MAG: NUDIX domain-containing protein [Anaerolineaceae bacterium]|nr:NUDIX domain-containing protein [Anaerolineaceae bacterium]
MNNPIPHTIISIVKFKEISNVLTYNLMQLLTQIFHKSDLSLSGKTVTREAVRAIILHGDQVLMVYSRLNGDYKFPGGGVEREEAHATALKREVLEECGAHLITILGEFGMVEEYDLAQEDEFDLFRMNSYYYLCEVEEVFGAQNLDDCELDYGFTPEWVSIEHAIAVNRALLENPPPNIQRWVRRELFVLEQLNNLERK